MTVNLTCTQVSALLSFYIDNKLSCELKQFVEAHLASCPSCRVKLETLKKMICSLREVHEKLAIVKNQVVEEEVEDAQYNEFVLNLSAYIDNELSDEENIKVKKYVISNPRARMELENMYNLKKVMHNSFEKTKHEVKDDFSKFIMRNMDIQDEVYSNDSFLHVVAIFVTIFAVFTITAVIIFWA